MADYGSGTRVRFRYTGLTTSAAQWLDDAAGTVTRHIANGWLGERLADWTGSGSNLRIYGTNGHHDVTWLATSTGTVSQALRYDPWGNPRPGSAPSGYTPFRFQGAWFDATTSLNWVITRWYAQSLGRFISEDTLLGDPSAPPSRHLYAYAAGEPIGRWDPDGRKIVRLSRNYSWNGSAYRYDTGKLNQVVSVVPICFVCLLVPIRFASNVRWFGDLKSNNRLGRWTLFTFANHDTRTKLAMVWITILITTSARFADGTQVILDSYQQKDGNGGVRCALCVPYARSVPMHRGKIVSSRITASLWYQLVGFEEPLNAAIFEYHITWHRK